MKKLINSLEESQVPFAFFLGTFVIIVSIRFFLEQFLTHIRIEWEIYLHYFLFYCDFALVLILTIHLWQRKPIVSIAKVVLPAFLLIEAAPIFDLIFSGGSGMGMSYLFPGIHGNLWERFLTFGGHYENLGITPGMKIEVAVILIATFFYLLSKSGKIFSSLIFIFLEYCLFFSFSLAPFAVKSIFGIMGAGESYVYNNEYFIYFFGILSLPLLILTLYSIDKKTFILILRDVRFLRISYFITLVALGISIGFSQDMAFGAESFSKTIITIISLILAIIFSIISNNIEDVEIDKISNQNRPLVKGEIDQKKYGTVGYISLALSLFYAGLSGFKTLFFVVLMTGIYFLYSVPPVKFKRVPIISKLAVSGASLIAILVGYDLLAGNFRDFPWFVAGIVLLGLTLAANFIDIKDYEGDKKYGIVTLPVLIGLKKSKVIISFFFLLSYMTIYFALRQYSNGQSLLPIMALFIILSLYFLNRKKYNENYVFLVILASLLFIVGKIF